MEPSHRIAEYITVILGGIGTFMLLQGFILAAGPSVGFNDLAVFILWFYQFIASMLALPFLIRGFRRERVIKWFAQIVLVEMLLNALIILLTLVAFGNYELQLILLFGVVAILQISPLPLYNMNKNRISSYALGVNQ